VQARFLIKSDGTASAHEELIPVWQWCKDTGGPSVFNGADDRWGTYLQEVSDDIERAFQANQARFELDLGVRKVDVVFTVDNRIYGLQIDSQFDKQRHVRRKMLVASEKEKLMQPLAEASASDDMCAICMGEFRSTATWPVYNTPCNHVFHGCCAQVLRDRQENRCPLCRQNVDWNSLTETLWEAPAAE